MVTRFQLKEFCSKYLMDNYSSARNLSGDTIPVVISKSLKERVLTPCTIYESINGENSCIRIYHNDNGCSFSVNARTIEVHTSIIEDIKDINFVYVDKIILPKEENKSYVSKELNKKCSDILEKIHRGGVLDPKSMNKLNEDPIRLLKIHYMLSQFIIFRDNFDIDDEKHCVYRICLAMKIRCEVRK